MGIICALRDLSEVDLLRKDHKAYWGSTQIAFSFKLVMEQSWGIQKQAKISHGE